MPNYQHGKIYKIVSEHTDVCYVGSTTESLKSRLNKHVSKYNTYPQTNKVYTTSFDIIKLKNYNIILLENCPCNNRKELETREKHYIKKLNSCNKVIPTRTQREYKNDHSEIYKDYDKRRYWNNRDKELKRSKEYHEKYKDKIKIRKQKYKEKNKDKIQEYNKDYCLKSYYYKNSWGGDSRSNNNLLKINLDIFK